MSDSREVGIDLEDSTRWWDMVNEEQGSTQWWNMVKEDGENNLEKINLQEQSSKHGNNNTCNPPRNEDKRDNEIIYQTNDSLDGKKTNISGIFIINGLLCDILRAIKFPGTSYDKETLTSAILRNSEESEIKEAWTVLFTHAFPHAWDNNLRMFIKDTVRQSDRLMIQDIITAYEKENFQEPSPNFSMPWYYKLKTFENNSSEEVQPLTPCPKCVAKGTTCQCQRCQFCSSYKHVAKSVEACKKLSEKHKRQKLEVGKCFNCQKRGHFSKNCPDKEDQDN